ncbi:non-ribosomal peptide synthetase/type I polyketide synthase [Acanthopleuribacter pedis]|uniref:Amino acid adenylation domain-containing protein n=1 Tax=Acanthopleuribacter pedis TaxID=442870 RepID=A0A8J7Q939_9BACT|nr:non-ribosomal peptide synthetase/type I polyketide synthase [Acanthopleuribacter pedis]MBO1319704.1 amino acid adenylation domain-containing protein [Acanthopleuribacter pedis]
MSHPSTPPYQQALEDAIAVIGYACRFPDAPDSRRFWLNLKNNHNAVRRLTQAELDAAGVPAEEQRAPGYVPFAAPVTGFDCFDARFFGFTKREAETLDPQQRLMLQTAYHALEDAGYPGAGGLDRVGVFAGGRFSDYLIRQLYANQEWLQQTGYFQALLGNDKDYLAPLLSYKLDLKGPSIAVQTACSTSLTAMHLACESLLSHNCNAALVGAVTLRLPQFGGYHYAPGGIFSPKGQVRFLDAAADGTVFGNGVGAVILKRYSDALEDGDTVHGLILGSAVNNDGGTKVGLTAPSADGQARVIADALAVAECEPDDLQVIECHGTGTALGDAIELNALNKVFGDSSTEFLLGSVKTNLGHLEAAAGMAGLIKILLMMRHRTLVRTLGFETANPNIDFGKGRFKPIQENQPWQTNSHGHRVAGLSSFGIGGTNAHLIVCSPPETRTPAAGKNDKHLFQISARDEAALLGQKAALRAQLADDPDRLADVAYSLRHHRVVFPFRFTCVAKDSHELRKHLGRKEAARKAAPQAGRLAFVFPGQGSQHVAMARKTYQHEPLFRQWIDRGLDHLQAVGKPEPARLWRDYQQAGAAELWRQTQHAQPLLYLVQVALAKLWQSWGIQPHALLGHSIGEWSAACIAEIVSFEQGLEIVWERGRLLQHQPGGAMLSVNAGEPTIRPYLAPDVCVAAFNAPHFLTLSGPFAAIDVTRVNLDTAGIKCRPLHTSHAFHAPSMAPAREAFAAFLRTRVLRTPKLPFPSNVSGTWMTDDQAVSPDWWARQLVEPVRFQTAVETMAERVDHWLEVGPGHQNTTFVRATLPEAVAHSSLPAVVAQDADDHRHLLHTAGRLWSLGYPLLMDPERKGGRLKRLPGYAFSSERFWVEARAYPGQSTAPAVPKPSQPATEARPAETSDQDAITQTLVAIWREQLGLDTVSLDADFFELGGHSLLATRILARIREQLGVELSLSRFFTGQTTCIRALAEVVRSEPKTDSSATPTIPRLTNRDALPLSAAQERMWFLFRLAPDNPAYNLPGSFDHHADLNVSAFKGALGDLLDRHEILRTRYPYRAGAPRAVVEPAASFTCTFHNLTHLSPAARAEAAAKLAASDAATPFDLENDLPVRAAIVELDHNHFRILLCLHHIAADGGSFTLLARDLLAFYQARLSGEAATLPPLAVQYGDYAAWQQQQLDGKNLAPAAAFWREQLADAPLVFDPFPDFERPPITDPKGARLALDLGPERSQKLRELARTHNLSLFVTLLTCFEVLLWNRSGRDDFLLGTHMTHRNRPELEPLVGLFVNQLVLRARLAGNPSFSDLLTQNRDQVGAAFDHGAFPFEKIVEMLQPDRDLSRNPIFQILFVFQNHPPAQADSDNLRPAEAGSSLIVRDDLRLELYDDHPALVGFIEYRTSIYHHQTISSLADQFYRLIDLICTDPTQNLRALALQTPHLDAAAQQAQHDHLRRPEIPLPSVFPTRLLSRCQTHPDNDAVIAEHDPVAAWRRLSYGALGREAQQLARQLLGRGLRGEDGVALFMDRSAGFVIGFCGTMLAGGMYVPLDTGAPPSRLAYQLDKSGARFILTTTALRDRLPEELCSGREVICLDAARDRRDVEDGGNDALPLPNLLPRQTAYILFTSGSTGEPKGVAVEHAQLAYYIDAMIERLELIPARYAWILATTADAGHTVLFPTLSIGGTIYAVDGATAAQPDSLARYLQNHRIEDLKVMPSLLQALQTGGNFSQVLPARHLVMTGEPAELTWIRKLQKAAPTMRIDNEYGPTETTVGVTVARFDGHPLDHLKAWPIGDPLTGVRCYIVDRFDRPVAPNMHGELHIGGTLVTRGYIGQPALTADRFRPDPFSPEPGARRYVTGDDASLNHDGDLLFHGRLDTQIKIRGFRVEPGEIESHLRDNTWIEHCVVRLVTEPKTRLVAYLVVRKLAPPEAELVTALRAWLGKRLPPILIPSAFILLPALPLSPNGKLNVRALPQPGRAQNTKTPPGTALERQLAAVWCQVLGLEAVGLEDNFFEIGGDSLMSIQLLALAGRVGLPLTAEVFFRHQTLGEQATVLADQGLDAQLQTRALVALQPAGEAPPLFCVHSAGGLVFGYINVARALGASRPFFALQDADALRDEEPSQPSDVTSLAARYAAEIEATQPEGDLHLAGHSFGGLVALACAERLRAKGRTVAKLILMDSFPSTEGEVFDAENAFQTTLGHMLRVFFRQAGQTPPFTAQELQGLPRDHQLERVTNALRGLPGNEQLNEQHLARQVAVFIHHTRAAHGFEPPLYAGDTLLIRPQQELDAEPADNHDRGWRAWLSRLQVVGVTGDHTTMLTAEHAETLANRIRAYLAGA